MTSTPANVTDDSFASAVLKAQGIVLVDFWAPWCVPCRQLSPILDEVAVAYEGKVSVAKIDIDDNPMVGGNYQVRGVPTLMLFKDGAPLDTKVGAMSRSQLTNWLDSHLA